MAKTYLDEVVNYPYTTVNKLSQSKLVVGLLLNNPDVDVDSEETEKELSTCIFDFDYVEGVIQEAKSFICIDTIIPQFTSPTVKDVYLTILVGVSKGAMPISSMFKSKGNRRDNLIREIDYILRDCTDYGIGGLKLKSIKPVNVNKDFSCKLLVYEVPSFANGGKRE